MTKIRQIVSQAQMKGQRKLKKIKIVGAVLYLQANHSRRKQRSGRRVLVYTLKFLALKKIGFSEKKNSSQKKKKKILPFFYATFQFGR